MTDKTYDVEYLEVGDTFEGGPLEQSYFISAVLGAGGEIKIEGNKVTIKSLPGKEKSEAKALESPKPVEKAPKPVEAVEEVKEEPKEEEEVAPAPKAKPGPKPKAAPAPKSEETAKEEE